MRTVSIYLPTGVIYPMEYSLTDNTVRKQKIREEYFDLSTRLLKITPHTEDGCTMEGEFLKLCGRKYSVNDIDKLPEELNSFKCTSKETQSALGFFGELNPLSNFYNCDFQYQNLTFHSSETINTIK